MWRQQRLLLRITALDSGAGMLVKENMACDFLFRTAPHGGLPQGRHIFPQVPTLPLGALAKYRGPTINRSMSSFKGL